MPNKNYHKIIPAVYIIFRKEDKILLSRRFNTGYADGQYTMVSGHVEPGESFTQAAIREAYEEAGVRINEQDLKVAHTMQRKSDDSERIDIFLEVAKWEGDITNNEPHKCDDLSWFDIHNLPTNLIPCIKFAIQQIASGITYSEYGY